MQEILMALILLSLVLTFGAGALLAGETEHASGENRPLLQLCTVNGQGSASCSGCERAGRSEHPLYYRGRLGQLERRAGTIDRR